METDRVQEIDEEFERTLYGRMTPEEAAAYLRQRSVVARSFGETLARLYRGDDLFERLYAFYRKLYPQANERSLTKKLQNWLADRNQPSDREDVFRIAFALDLFEDQLDYLLGLTSGYGIQYRDGRELVLAWFLRNERSYAEALAFYAALPAYDPAEAFAAEEASHATHEIRTRFDCVETLGELRACYIENLGTFGRQHARAHFYFERYLEQLVHPVDESGKSEASYSIDAVMNTYLGLGMPASRRRKNLSLVQRLIKQNWPNATALKRIRNHQEDVPRKLLLLLYVVTENAGFAEEFGEEGDTRSVSERVRDHWATINAMLVDCGMAELDLRNAFDWLVMYAVSADDDEPMSERMQGVVATLYGT